MPKIFENNNAFFPFVHIMKVIPIKERGFMKCLSRLTFLVLCVLAGLGHHVFAAPNEETEVRTQEVVGNIVSVDQEEFSFDLEFESDEPSKEKKVATFILTDISTIDIAMTEGTISDLKPGLKVLVEFAPMSDGANVVESVWVKKS